MKINCKSPGCLGYVDLDPHDKVIGNFSLSQLPDKTILINAKQAIPEGKTVGILKVIQPEYAEVKEQVVLFQKNDSGKIEQTDRFYLTCDATPSHTLSYTIKIEDE